MPPVIVAAVVSVGASYAGAVLFGTAATAAAFSWGSAFATAAFSAAVSLVGETLARPKSQQSPMTAEVQNRKQLVRASADPRRAVYGTVQVSGTLLYASNGTDTNYVHLVIALAGHSSHAIGDCWLGDELLGTLDAGGNCTTGRFAGHVRVKKHLGSSSQAADADLNAECPEWAAKSRPLKGITYVYLRIKRNREVFPMGLPTPRFMLSGKNDILDPRSGLSGYTTNAALCTLDYILWKHGIGSTLDEVVQSTWIAAANGCDEDVAMPGGGTQKRYTINGSFTLDRNPVDVLDEMRSGAMAGCASYSMGVWEGHAGIASAPVMDLSEADLRGPYKVRMRPSRAQLYNAVKGTYISAADRWVETDFPPAINSAYEAQDGGERIYKDVKLPFTIDPYAAQRMAKIDLERHRQGIVVDYPARIVGLKLKVWDVVRLNIAAMGWTNKQFRVIDKKISLFGGADLVLEEYSSAIYSWTSLEATPVDAAPDTTLPNPFSIDPPYNVTAVSAPITALDGSLIHRLRVAWVTPDNTFIRAATIQYRLVGASVWDECPVDDVSLGEVVIAPLAAGSYDVRMRWETSLGIHSQWTLASGSAGAAQTAPAAVTSLTATGGLFKVHLDWAYGDARRDVIAEIYGSNSNDRATATRLTQARWPALEFDHVGLGAGQSWYYWLRVVDTSGNVSAWYPAGATAGLYAAASSDPSALLTQLQNSLGLQQLASELAAPILQVPDALIAAQAAAESALRLLLKADALKTQAVRDKWILDATSTVDPATGKVTLLATAEIATDVEAMLNSVQLELGAMDGSIISHTPSLANHGGRLSTAETDIAQLQGEIALTASQSYVDGSIEQVLGVLDPAAVEAASQAGAEGLLRALLDADAGRRTALGATARIATAELRLISHADALVAEATERLILAAQVGNNLAALVLEQLARVTADSALASSTATLQARLNNGDFAAVKEESSASASAIEGVEAKWGVQVQTMQDGNQAVAGIQLLSGANGTVFAILADKLVVYLPDGSGTPKQVIVLGTVNGTSALGLDGDMIIDGSIVARSLAVTDLSAITANLGTVTAGRAQNTGNTNYLNLDAVGAQTFLQCGGNITIDADGNATFSGVVLSRNLAVATGTAAALAGAYAITAGEGWKKLNTITIDTGYSAGSWLSANDQTFQALAGLVRGGSSSVTASYYTTAGAFVANWSVVASRLYVKSRWSATATIHLELELWAEVDGDIFQLTFTQPSWNLFKVT